MGGGNMSRGQKRSGKRINLYNSSSETMMNHIRQMGTTNEMIKSNSNNPNNCDSQESLPIANKLETVTVDPSFIRIPDRQSMAAKTAHTNVRLGSH